jgi:hypothetical protein
MTWSEVDFRNAYFNVAGIHFCKITVYACHFLPDSDDILIMDATSTHLGFFERRNPVREITIGVRPLDWMIAEVKQWVGKLEP